MRNTYTSIIIDDESSSLDLISDYMRSHNDIKVIHKFNNPLMALSEIRKLSAPIDILFIDIEMPSMSGIELATLIKHKIKKLIFITAHTKYAYDTYELNADGYLLKPFSELKFSQILNKILPPPDDQILWAKENNNFILLKVKNQRNKLIRINLNDVIAIESQDKEIKVYMMNNEAILARSSLLQMIKLLEHKKDFIRIHKSFIISQQHIKGIERKYVFLSMNLKLPIGRLYKDFYRQISN
ncbi:LytTR family DNA-binding domain-containing protein [Pedobacter sp. R20-19]|uniref:LytR/AlgR family response regulator transcription factor n=1 Tax=Pedobacter sp. R20-19 TaxID=1270196 RepID=UPI0004933A9F|nr:LytTR family DNA-binding domain-containing protein [Pedobacter sp. R20-19]